MNFAKAKQSLFLSFLFFFFVLSVSPSLLFSLDSLSYKIGQMVMTGFIPYSDFEDTLKYDIEHRNLGGVILMGYNLRNRDQISELTGELKSLAETPLFIATDEEGGYVARLNQNNGFESTYSAYYLGSEDQEGKTRGQASKMAGWLADMDMNVNLAPVADVNVNPNSPAIGSLERSFSSDPADVAKHCYWYYSEFRARHVASTLKHFPGHGSAVGDSHDGFTDVTNTWSTSELIPYKTLIDTGYSHMVMTGHLYNAHIDTSYPATLSKATLTGILRDSLGFQGVIITDDMRMRAISDNYSFIESVTRAIDAGVDILLYCGNEKFGTSVLKQIVKVVKTAIDSGMITEARIDESYDRIMALKTAIQTSVSPGPPMVADSYELTAYPNPFNPVTKISFRIEDDLYETAQLNIFSVGGRLVQRYFIRLNGPGDYDVTWDARSMNGKAVPSGTYIYGLQLNGTLHTGKMTLLK